MTAPVRALVFDFDGLILETEEPEYTAWSEIYRKHGEALSLELWGDVIGRGPGFFDPVAELEERLGRELEGEVIRRSQRVRHDELIAALDVLPGVTAYLADARRLGLRLAVASSSSRRWVGGHLERLRLTDFDCVRCRDDVVNAKPWPDLYLAACECLGVAPSEAVALEDSANGIRAAKAAGLRCVAVPSRMTAGLDLSAADLRVESLAAQSLGDLLRRLARSE